MSTGSEDISAARLAELVEISGDFSEARPKIVALYQSFIETRRRELKDYILAQNSSDASVRKRYSAIMDELLRSVFALVTEKLYPLATPTKGERISIYAVGGYGRYEMAPYSDVDIVIIIPYKQTAWHENVIETILYLLWDLRIKLGYSVRSIDECLPLAQSDVTIRTAMLESRYIAGDRETGETALELLRNKLFNKTISEFVEAKLQEREERHEKSGIVL